MRPKCRKNILAALLGHEIIQVALSLTNIIFYLTAKSICRQNFGIYGVDNISYFWIFIKKQMHSVNNLCQLIFMGGPIGRTSNLCSIKNYTVYPMMSYGKCVP